MQYISTMDNWQREQAIAPSATMNDLECIALNRPRMPL